MTNLLWLGPMRTSTAVLVILFLAAAVHRRDWRPVLALGAWLFSFEALWQSLSRAHGYAWSSHTLDFLGSPWVFLGIVVTAWLAGVRPRASWSWLALALLVVWWATGFQSNGDGASWVDWRWEAVNEATKTSWGLAYLFCTRPRRLLPAGSPAGSLLLRWAALLRPLQGVLRHGDRL